jgi:hypothetical protein
VSLIGRLAKTYYKGAKIMPENQITPEQQMIRLIADNIGFIGTTKNWRKSELAVLFLYVAYAESEHSDFWESHTELIDLAKTWRLG